MVLVYFCKSCIKYKDVILYFVLFNLFILVNKYVLSVVGFRFPAVFQGWQTLVSSACLLRLRRQIPHQIVSQATAATYHRLLDALLFIAVIISGSKALSAVPVPLFLCIQNVPCLCYLILSLHKVPLTEFFIAITGLSSSLCLFIFKDENVSDDGLFWLIWHCITSMIFETYFQSEESVHKEIAKNFFRNVLSVGVLLLWILLTEEGESASNFIPEENAWFISACVASGVLCAVIHAFAARTRFSQGNVAQTLARLPPLLLSLSVFPQDKLSFYSWNLISVNMICTLLLSLSVPQTSSSVDSLPTAV